jgi:phosphoribosylamine--glycine ligase
MHKYKIPTAAYGEFTLDNYKDGVDYINKHALPIVLKADGLAAAKALLFVKTMLKH